MLGLVLRYIFLADFSGEAFYVSCTDRLTVLGEIYCEITDFTEQDVGGWAGAGWVRRWWLAAVRYRPGNFCRGGGVGRFVNIDSKVTRAFGRRWL